MSSSYKFSKQLGFADGTEADVEGVNRCERFAGGRWAGESDLLAIGDGWSGNKARVTEIISARTAPGGYRQRRRLGSNAGGLAVTLQ